MLFTKHTEQLQLAESVLAGAPKVLVEVTSTGFELPNRFGELLDAVRGFSTGFSAAEVALTPKLKPEVASDEIGLKVEVSFFCPVLL